MWVGKLSKSYLLNSVIQRYLPVHGYLWKPLLVPLPFAAFGIFLFCTIPSLAHVISLSNGTLRIEGSLVTYDLRMPLYEITHLEQPRETLLENFHVLSGGQKSEPENITCREDTTGGWYLCRMEFTFSTSIDQLDIECYFADVTVPNHVHLLRAELGDIKKQVVFDFSTTKATINFVPPTPTELAWSEIGAGLTRVLIGPMQILFVLGLSLAGRSRRELFYLATAFLVCESVSAMFFLVETWQPSARFLEAAGALTVAYLAIEVLLLPEAGYRWIVAATMGLFHGFYFGNFLSQSEMNPLFVLIGVNLAEVMLLIIFTLLLDSARRHLTKLHPIRTSASLLLAVGLFWFFLRLKS